MKRIFSSIELYGELLKNEEYKKRIKIDLCSTLSKVLMELDEYIPLKVYKKIFNKRYIKEMYVMNDDDHAQLRRNLDILKKYNCNLSLNEAIFEIDKLISVDKWKLDI